jgi:hypothetical protein
VRGTKAEPEASKKIEGVTEHTELEKITVKGSEVKAEPEKETVFKAEKPAAASKPVVVREPRKPREPKLADVAKGKGEAGEKARTLLTAIKSKKPDASPEEVETLLKAGGVAMNGETETLVAAEEAAAIEEERKFEGVTEHIELEKITVKGEKAEADAKTKIDGVTDVRKDEKIVVKGEKPQDLVDRSITRIKAEPQDKERELKMKALAGSTEFMKMALSGAADKVAEMLAATPVELRKTDAEGRTAIHYAAMGGAVAVIKFLVEKGASLNNVDSKRRSALYLAALYKQNDAFDFLLAQGSKINQQAMGGMTIAMVGAFTGNMHILKAAAQKGVRFDSRDHAGKTALDYAKQAKAPEAVAFIEGLAKAAPAAGAEKAEKAAAG